MAARLRRAGREPHRRDGVDPLAPGGDCHRQPRDEARRELRPGALHLEPDVEGLARERDGDVDPEPGHLHDPLARSRERGGLCQHLERERAGQDWPPVDQVLCEERLRRAKAPRGDEPAGRLVPDLVHERPRAPNERHAAVVRVGDAPRAIGRHPEERPGVQHPLRDEERLGGGAVQQLGEEPVAPLLGRDGRDAHRVEPRRDVRVRGGPADSAPGRPVHRHAVHRLTPARGPRGQERRDERVRAGVVGLASVAEARDPRAERHHGAYRIGGGRLEEVEEARDLRVDGAIEVRLRLRRRARGALDHRTVADERHPSVPRAHPRDEVLDGAAVRDVARLVLDRDPLRGGAGEVAVQVAIGRARPSPARTGPA